MLLAQPGIGPTVIARIEATGIHSLEALQLAGVQSVVEMVCLGLGTVAWSNRSRALERALGRLESGSTHGVPRHDACPGSPLNPLQLEMPAPRAECCLHRGHPGASGDREDPHSPPTLG